MGNGTELNFSKKFNQKQEDYLEMVAGNLAENKRINEYMNQIGNKCAFEGCRNARDEDCIIIDKETEKEICCCRNCYEEYYNLKGSKK